MKKLVGYLIKNKKILKTVEKEYTCRQEFFIAIVSIANELEINVPIWTLKEDRKLDKNNEVLIKIDNQTIFKVESVNI